MCSLGLGHGLPDALRQLLATWDVNVTASCEKFLERLIAADQQDLASRRCPMPLVSVAFRWIKLADIFYTHVYGG